MGRCQAILDHLDASGRCNQRQDAGDTGGAKTTSLTSGRNSCASGGGFIFADVHTKNPLCVTTRSLHAPLYILRTASSQLDADNVYSVTCLPSISGFN